ncbi:xylose isomerase domain-containing protein [Paenibacillus algicola]|uniref:Xylose isomerase domain-containing protein n=1 Tax=Paenibacillus algicola TaxID=2565926 RepID=A0A4P8XF07_9BACL|nr:TIM barrel protein [Paenibacillus algicola]QCT00967.1 xylose isomerase domain-containing protein [Paenibacillus algicola]
MMKLNVYMALWGLHGSFEELCSKAAEAGFTGIECPLPPQEREEEFRKALQSHSLGYIAQVVSGGDSVEDHIRSFQEQVERTAAFQPVHIVSHSARDRMSDAEQDTFFESALRTEEQHGMIIAHETHRHRAMFTPWTTARLLRKFPELKITADFSHWTNVCESLLGDLEEDLALAIRHTHHIHGRIGHTQGPQVPHPGAPEWTRERECFEGWWESMLKHRSEQGETVTTFTPEFGPVPYMPTLAFTNQPVSSLWEVNLWMAHRAGERFASL